MWQACILAAALVGSSLAQVQDLTRKEGASGAQVVESVVNLIQESCVFPNNHLLLRRYAYVVTNDGQDSQTYRPGFDGGIWAVSQGDFTSTKNDRNLDALYAEIQSLFGIDWNSVQWRDLRKPLYSGLAEAISLVQYFQDTVPLQVEQQAAWYQKTYYPSQPMAAYNFTKLSQDLDSVCSSSNLDLAFMVDSSSSLSPVDFNSALTFAANVLDTFTVNPQAVRVAFLTFATGFRTVFDFKRFNDKASVQNAIRSAVYYPGETDTDAALQYGAKTLFTQTSGARDASAKVAVVITDGQATHSADALLRAQELRDKGVTIFVIGVGDAINLAELQGLATQPNCTHVSTLKGYQDLDTMRAQIQQVSCSAPVVLNEGNYTFPCDTINNYRIYINGNETIKVRPDNGYVEVYGSFLNPRPNAAFNEFHVQATTQTDAIIYVQQETRPLYLSIVARSTDPAVCGKGVNYRVTVENKNALTRVQPNTVCYEAGILRACTVLDYLRAIYRVVRPTNLGFPTPCVQNTPGYYIHPFSFLQFVYCTALGVPYIVYCPSNFWYNDAQRTCIYGTPPKITNPPVVITSPRPIITATPVSTGGNPCTQGAISSGQRFFPYPPDQHKYIACTEWPNYGVIKDCAQCHKWSQPDVACIYDKTVTDVTNCQLDVNVDAKAICKRGLVTGDNFYFPYPGDNTRFIQCDQFGDAFELSCQTGKVWNDHFKTCIPNGLLPQNNVPVG